MQVNGLNIGRFAPWWVLLFVVAATSLPIPNSGRVLAIVFSLLGVELVLVIYGTIRKNRWGINLEAVSCPRCKQIMPHVRAPRSMSETMWGGGTCERCGCEMDEWGREIGFA
jgi:hypothetical protein